MENIFIIKDMLECYKDIINNTKVLQKTTFSNLWLITKPEFHIMIVSGISPLNKLNKNSFSPGED
ncbi:hypothetical protein BTM29_04795 [Companilactobacillus allii]|uniref:Uncharacterized protein n=1 Tax=Companilactobacillus allii TaxID=1847728 RepID=A0A1P8Q209_9LACO|nr:hypothetical protein BTM29_04795 [Companilactobacillus allii]